MRPREGTTLRPFDASQGFPRWEVNLHASSPDACVTRAGFGATVETAMRVSGTETPSSSSVSDRASLSSSDFVVACGGATDCVSCACRSVEAAAAADYAAEDFVGMEFQNNWPRIESGTDSDSTIEDGPLSAVRELVVKFAINDDLEARTPQRYLRTLTQRQTQHLEYRRKLQSLQQANASISHCDAGGSSRGKFPAWRESPPSQRRRAFLSNSSNAAVAATAEPAEAAAEEAAKKRQPEEPPEAPRKAAACCLQACSPLRVLLLAVYYLALWCVTAAVTYAFLVLFLHFTSRGSRLPYYMSQHSFFLQSPKIGFAIGNAEAGQETKLANLAAVRDVLKAKLQQVGSGRRSCDSLTDTMDEAELMKPCNMTLFVATATERMEAVLMNRPAVIIEIRRHLGYMPVSGPALEVTCTCAAGGKSLALRYYSWDGANMTESSSSGTVLSNYFPMLTKQHYAPSVLVALDSAVTEDDWVGKQLKLQCGVSDGGSESSKEERRRELLLVVNRVRD